MTDPFDDLKSEVQNNLAALQNLLVQAEKERPTANRQTVDELLLSLQGTREDADLLRSACRSLRRKASDNPATSNDEKAMSVLRQREQFCERTDDELDRIQLIIEDMQRKLMELPPVMKNLQQQQQNTTNNNNKNKPTAASSSSSNYSPQNDDQEFNDVIFGPSSSKKSKNNNNEDNDEVPLSSQFSSNNNSNSNSPSTTVLIDIKDWDRDAALKKIKMRAKRREEEEGKSLADVGPPHDGTWQGRAMYYYNNFKIWTIEFVDTLTPNQRIGWLVGMSFVVVFLLVALFTHRSK
jgi:hypothetical protein